MSNLEPQRDKSLDYRRIEPTRAREVDWENIMQGFLGGIGFGLIGGLLFGVFGSIYGLAVFNAPICLAIAPFRWFNMVNLWLSGTAVYGIYFASLCAVPRGKRRWAALVICAIHATALLFMRWVL